MRRWFLWLLAGFLLFVVGGSAMAFGTPPVQAVGKVLGLMFWVWAYTTFFAVPIGFIVWLVRGRSPRAGQA